MGRFRALSTIGVLMAMATVFFAGPAGAAPSFPGIFTVTPNPVVAGHEITFAGTDCLQDEGAPAGSPVTAMVDAISPPAAATRAAAARAGLRPMSDSPLQVTPDARGDWSVTILVPSDVLPGDYEFSAVCDRYNSSDQYPPVTLAVQINLDAPAEVLLLDFLDSASTPLLSAGKPYEFVGLGFGPNEKVMLTLHSVAVDLATYTTDPHFGFIDGILTLPARTENGAHQLTFTGQTSHKAVTVPISVIGGVVLTTTAPTTPVTTTVTTTLVTTTAEPTSAAATTTAISLASTGTAAGQTLWFGTVLTLLGVATLLLARRRSQRAH